MRILGCVDQYPDLRDRYSGKDTLDAMTPNDRTLAPFTDPPPNRASQSQVENQIGRYVTKEVVVIAAMMASTVDG